MITPVEYAKHLNSLGFKEVHHIRDKTLDDRNYFLAVNKETKTCRLVQLGPDKLYFFEAVPILNVEEKLEEFKKFGDYEFVKYTDYANLYHSANGGEQQ